MEHKLLTVREAADRLTISPNDMYQMIYAGTIPATHLSEKRVRVLESDLDAYIAAVIERDAGYTGPLAMPDRVDRPERPVTVPEPPKSSPTNDLMALARSIVKDAVKEVLKEYGFHS